MIQVTIQGDTLAAERHIVSLYATVKDDCWFDEERRKWRPINEFFEDRK